MGTYFLFMYIPTMFCLINNYIKTRRNYFIIFSLIFLILIGYTRYEFGADYVSYYKIYNYILNNEIEQVKRFELGYIFLNKVFIFFKLHFNALIGTITLFNLILIYKTIFFILEKTKYFYLCIFTYMSLYSLFFYHLSMIRQSIAISLFFYSIKFIYNKKFKEYIFIIIIATFFHKSAILLLPVYFFIQVNTLKIMYYNLFLIFCYIISLNRKYMINLYMTILKILNMENYIYYIFTKSGGELFSFKNIVIILVTYVFLYLLKNEKNEKYKLVLKILILNNLIYIFSMGAGILILNRIVDYFKIFYIFFPIIMLKKIYKIRIKNLNIKNIFIISYIIFMNLYFINTYIKSIEIYKNMEYYKNLNINPLRYKNIFFINDKYRNRKE